MRETHRRRGKPWLRALTLALAACALAAPGSTQGGAQGADPLPGAASEGNRLPPVTLRNGRHDDERIWSGSSQRLSVTVSVAEGERLAALELLVVTPKAGKRREPKTVRELTAAQMAGREPVQWVLQLSEEGPYQYHFLAQAVGVPEIVQFPPSGYQTFRVDNLWKVIGLALGVTMLMAIFARLVVSGLMTRLVKNQTRVAPFSLVVWLVVSTAVWGVLFFPAFWVWIVVGAAVCVLLNLIYAFA